MCRYVYVVRILLQDCARHCTDTQQAVDVYLYMHVLLSVHGVCIGDYFVHVCEWSPLAKRSKKTFHALDWLRSFLFFAPTRPPALTALSLALGEIMLLRRPS